MAISDKVADIVVEIILNDLSRRDAQIVLDELSRVDGGQSFNETIKMLYDRVAKK